MANEITVTETTELALSTESEIQETFDEGYDAETEFQCRPKQLHALGRRAARRDLKEVLLAGRPESALDRIMGALESQRNRRLG